MAGPFLLTHLGVIMKKKKPEPKQLQKRNPALHELYPIERLKKQQKTAELDALAAKLSMAGGKTDKIKDYQGPMGFAGSGTRDRMPGTSGYTISEPNLLESLLDKLKIKPFKSKEIKLKPSRIPVEKYKGAI